MLKKAKYGIRIYLTSSNLNSNLIRDYISIVTSTIRLFLLPTKQRKDMEDLVYKFKFKAT